MKYPVLLVAVLAVSACAKAPEQIAAADIGSGVYRGQSCAQLTQQRLKISQDLENLSAAQKSAQSGDAWGVFLLGLPLSSMSGNDKETAIAVAKGHVQEIDKERQRKGCR